MNAHTTGYFEGYVHKQAAQDVAAKKGFLKVDQKAIQDTMKNPAPPPKDAILPPGATGGLNAQAEINKLLPKK